jgi:4-hydroxy-2-oxoheptanedioate aldolase
MTSLAAMSTQLREAWATRQATHGAWCSIPDSFSAEVLGRVGYDWACLDLQHGMTGADHMLPMMQALSATDTPTFVRVPWNEPAPIMRALDMGAVGVIVPMIDSADEAKAAVAACRYAPQGIRSYGPTRAALLVPQESPTDEVNRQVICAVMVETTTALDQVDEIMAVQGVDVVFVGPADLRVSIGAPSIADPGFVDVLARIAARAEAHGVVPGVFCPTVESAIAWRRLGYLMLAVESDVRLLRRSAAASLTQVRTQTEKGSDERPQGSGYV